MTAPRWSRGSRTVDLVAVLALTGLALAGFAGSYAGQRHLVVGLVAAALAGALAVGTDARGHGTAVLLLVAVPAYLLFGGWVVMGSLDALGFPSAAAMLDLLTGTITGPNDLLTTIPPVDPAGEVLALPWALAFVAALAASWAALRTARPLLPAVPLLGALGAVLLVGTDDPGAVAVRGVVAGCVLIGWAAVRSARVERVRDGHRGRAARVAGAGLLLASIGFTAFAAMPEPSSERTLLRGNVGRPADVGNLDNPLANFRRYTDRPEEPGNLHDRTLIRVEGLPRRARIRIATLDDYDGVTWNPSNRTVPDATDDLFQQVSSTIAAQLPGREVAVAVEVRNGYSSDWLPVTGQLTSVEFDYLDREVQRSSVRLNRHSRAAFVLGGLTEGDDYRMTAVLPEERLTPAMRPYPEVGPAGAAGKFLDPWLEPWQEADLSPMRKVYSLARYLRRYGRYSDGAREWEQKYTAGHDPARLGEGFIGAPVIVGNDEQYAAFMALAANRLGVPARVVVGGIPSRGVLRGRHVAAWIEVRVEDGSWRTLPAATFRSHRPPRQDEPRRPPTRDFVGDEPVREDDGGSRPEVRQSPGDRTPSPDSGGTREEPDRAWLLVLLTGTAVGGVPALKWSRRRLRRTTGSTTERLVAAWWDLADTAADLRVVVPRGATRTRQAEALGVGEDLARRIDRAVFGAADPPEAQVQAAWQEVTDARHGLRRRHPWWARAAAWYSPASLRASVVRRRRRGSTRGRIVTPDRGLPPRRR